MMEKKAAKLERSWAASRHMGRLSSIVDVVDPEEDIAIWKPAR